MRKVCNWLCSTIALTYSIKSDVYYGQFCIKNLVFILGQARSRLSPLHCHRRSCYSETSVCSPRNEIAEDEEYGSVDGDRDIYCKNDQEYYADADEDEDIIFKMQHARYHACRGMRRKRFVMRKADLMPGEC